MEQERQKCIAQQKGLLATQKELQEQFRYPVQTQDDSYNQKKSSKKSVFAESRQTRIDIYQQMEVVQAKKLEQEMLT